MKKTIVFSVVAMLGALPATSLAIEYVGSDVGEKVADEAPAYMPKFQSASELSRYDALINGGSRSDIIQSANIAAADCGGMTAMKEKADSGHPQALYYLAGLALYQLGDYKGAPPEVGLRMLERAANAVEQESESRSQSTIPERAMAKFMLYSIDKNILGETDVLYDASQKIMLSDSIARQYLVAGADAGIAHAQHELGKVIREEKLGFKRNIPVSLIYTSKAAKAKYRPAMTELKAIKDTYTSVRKLAYVRKGVANGDMDSLLEMIRMYKEGDGVPRNLVHAKELQDSLDLISSSLQ